MTPDFYLGDTTSPAYVRNFDGRVRSCYLLEQIPIVRGDERYRGWHIRVEPHYPADWGPEPQVVLMETDGRNIAELGDDPINVIVYYVSNTPALARGQLTFRDLTRLHDFAQVANDPSHLDLHGWLFQDEMGRVHTHDGFIAHVRDQHGVELRAGASGNTETLETLDVLRLADLHAALHRPERP